jgi:hypothetical protein
VSGLPPSHTSVPSYAKFNAIARRLHLRLTHLEAEPVCERGLGDDQSEFGMEGEAKIQITEKRLLT